MDSHRDVTDYIQSLMCIFASDVYLQVMATADLWIGDGIFEMVLNLIQLIWNVLS